MSDGPQVRNHLYTSVSFGSFLGGMRHMLPPSLLSGGGWHRLLSMAERLPLGVIDQPFGFEFALGEEAAKADFCVCPMRGSSLSAHYIREGAAAPRDSAAAALGDCLDRDKDDPMSFLRDRGGGVILEYDVPDVIPEEPAVPGIFFVPLSSACPKTPAKPIFVDSISLGSARNSEYRLPNCGFGGGFQVKFRP